MGIENFADVQERKRGAGVVAADLLRVGQCGLGDRQVVEIFTKRDIQGVGEAKNDKNQQGERR